MKFTHAFLLIAMWGVQTEAFSAVAPKASASVSSGAPNLDPVDKTMRGIDSEPSFDPTDGDSPALNRNNKGEVWVSQVSSRRYFNKRVATT